MPVLPKCTRPSPTTKVIEKVAPAVTHDEDPEAQDREAMRYKLSWYTIYNWRKASEKERELYMQLCHKYEVTPCTMKQGAAAESSRPSTARRPEAVRIRRKTW